MVNCALCSCEILSDNNTKEHVIPNAIGGRKKITNFICNQCNQKSGAKWDVELAEQLNPLGLLFNISRERGVVPSQEFQTISGRKITLNYGGTQSLPKPELKKEIEGKGSKLKITARNLKEAIGMLEGYKKRHAGLTGVPEIKEVSEYLSEPIEFSLLFGGLGAGRSLVKSTLALVADAGVDCNECKLARNYLLSDDAEPCFGYYYVSDPILNRTQGIPLHCVYVRGVPETKMILGYVEFYGYLRMLVCLSGDYEGGAFENSYALNPVNGKALDLIYNLQVSREDVIDCYNYALIPDGSIENALSQVLPTAIQDDFEREKERVINAAVKYAFENCGAKYGEELTCEQQDKLSRLLIERLSPFIISQIRH